MTVGASLSATAVPHRHMRLLHLPKTARMRLLCGVEPDASYLGDSDDEVWLRDDVPSARWLSGMSECIAAGAPAHSPTPPPSAVTGSARAVHEADASSPG